MARKHKRFFLILLFSLGGGAGLEAQMNPYFTAINHPVPQDTMMVMLLSDFQSARSTNDFFTGMSMVQYGLTPRWTVGFMVEGQKIFGMPTTYGGLRINSYFRVFPKDHLLNFTLYGEYEGLNGAALYKMEVAGFGGEDLNEPLATARRTHVRTFEQRAIMYHDWGGLTSPLTSSTRRGWKTARMTSAMPGGCFGRLPIRQWRKTKAWPEWRTSRK
jgi:hypothetical protein